MTKLVKSISILAISISLQACSVGMALNGKKDPNLSILKKGAERYEVEMELGNPKSITAEGEDIIAVYEYEIGNEPSAGRAIAHGALDICTLGLWEIVGTPVEAVQGDNHKIAITYDKNARIKSIKKGGH